MDKKKFNKFFFMGVTSIYALTGAAFLVIACAGQSTLYDSLITTPVEKVQGLFDIHDTVKEKYEGFIELDKKSLTQIKIPQKMVDIDIVLKTNKPIDKVFLPVFEFGQWALNMNEDKRADNFKAYNGLNSKYVSGTNPDGNIYFDYIMVGINALENKPQFYKNLYKIFDYDEEKMSSFIFFHEFGHQTDYKLNNQPLKIKRIIELFEKEKGMTLTKEDVTNITKQYSETFADTFSLHMLMKRYTDINFEKTRDLIAGLRLNDGEDNHLTSPGLIQANKLQPDASLNDILKSAEHSALSTTQFYSSINFADLTHKNTLRAKPVHLIDLDNDTVRKNMQDARDKFLASNKNILGQYKE